MKETFAAIRSAVMATLILAVLGCGAYPLLVFGMAQLLFHDKANGSLIADEDGTIRGSELLGQPFAGEKYFHPRPSAAGRGYDAANSSGSNLGPTSRSLHAAIEDRVQAYRQVNGMRRDSLVPADAVTASGSGLDPHISVRNAFIQAARVARARGLAENHVRELIRKNTDDASLGVFGEPGVNVLALNLALDGLAGP